MPSLDFEAEKSVFKETYGQSSALFGEAVESFRTLVALLLTDNDQFPTPTVTGRLKDREECIQKFARKYLAKFEEAKAPYAIRDHISDLFGVRAVCLYEDDIQKVRDVIASNFEIRQETDKSQFMESSDSTFGYKGLHLDLSLLGNRKTLPEYRRFRDFEFELQIRTIAQDAWSTIDHKIKYKKEIPHNLKRRINRLAALFELADQEFQHIRDDTQLLENQANVGVLQVVPSEAAPTADANVATVPIDAFSFLSVMKSEHPHYEFHPHKVDGFVSELREIDPRLTLQGLSEAISSTHRVIESYKEYQRNRYLNRLNPYTVVRHVLYLADKNKFASLLFDLQRANFDTWLATNDPSRGAA